MKQTGKQGGKTCYGLVPFLFALPVVAGLAWVFVTHGDTIRDLITVACKVVLVR